MARLVWNSNQEPCHSHKSQAKVPNHQTTAAPHVQIHAQIHVQMVQRMNFDTSTAFYLYSVKVFEDLLNICCIYT